MPDAGHVSARPPSVHGNRAPMDRIEEGLEPSWVERSDRIARPILEMIAHFEPEIFAPIGVPGTARRIARLPPRRCVQR